MRWCAAVCLVAFTIGCGVDITQPSPRPPLSTFSPPCEVAPCTDLYVVAHEDDDLLFMNPDIANSIEAGNHVVVIHLTAGDISPAGMSRLADQPTPQQYWVDRERGSLNAYTFMAEDAAYTAYVPGMSISSAWSATTLEIAGVQMTEYDLAQDSESISLVYLRLSDMQLEDAWLNNPGHGGRFGTATPLPAGTVQTLACTDCPLGTDLPAQLVTRDQLTQVLAGLITHFTTGSLASSVSFQDASGLYIDGLGTPADCNPHGRDHGRACGYRDYWDHVYGAMFTLSAALTAQAQQLVPLALREYRDYSISQEPPTLTTCPRRDPWCDSQTTTKTQIMAYYALYDDGIVDHGATGFSVTQPSFAKAEAALKRRTYDPVANKPPTYDDYDANSPRGWESRQVELQSIRGARGRLTANGSCLGADATTVHPVDCANAPTWQLTTTGQLTAPDGSCLTVTDAGAVVLGPCSTTTAETTMVLFDSDQIRTANAGCLSMTATVASVPCANPRDADPRSHPHAEGIPVVDQDWTFIAP